MLTIIQILLYLLNILGWLVIAAAVISMLFAFNVLSPSNHFLRQVLYSLDRLLEPLYRPLRRILPASGGIDWSPFFLLVAIGVLKIILGNVAYAAV